MSAGAVGDYLAGNLAGQRLVSELKDEASGQDRVYQALRAHCPELSNEYVRGLLRSLQKSIERGGRHG